MKYEDVLHRRKPTRLDEKWHKYKDRSHATTTFNRNREDFHSPAKQTDPNGDEEFEPGSIVEMFCRLLRQQAAPVVDMESFDGNPMDYHFFMATFREVVEKNVIDARGRLTRLIKYTSGEARELIQHCIHLPQTVGYETARDLLQRRYGSPYTVMSAYRKEIKMWPTIKAGDAVGFRRFHIFLIKCQSISPSLTWNMLENQDMICTLLTKLPVYVMDRWNRQVLNIRRRQNREPRFADFLEFLDEESVLVSDPLFSRQAVEALSDEKGKKNKLRNYAIVNQQIYLLAVLVFFVAYPMTLTNAPSSFPNPLRTEVPLLRKRNYALDATGPSAPPTQSEHALPDAYVNTAMGNTHPGCMDTSQRGETTPR
eukprot:gene2301-2650_t